MTVKLVVLYTQPDDADAFDEHYLGVHGPLVEQVPGLVRWEGARFTAAADRGELTYHRIAELWFEDADVAAGRRSPPTRARPRPGTTGRSPRRAHGCSSPRSTDVSLVPRLLVAGALGGR